MMRTQTLEIGTFPYECHAFAHRRWMLPPLHGNVPTSPSHSPILCLTPMHLAAHPEAADLTFRRIYEILSNHIT